MGVVLRKSGTEVAGSGTTGPEVVSIVAMLKKKRASREAQKLALLSYDVE